jgi:hypothetical protein
MDKQDRQIDRQAGRPKEGKKKEGKGTQDRK